MGQPRIVRWGILATGGIAETFTKDLLIDPRTRGTNDIRHVVVGVASSSSVTSAEAFISKIVDPKSQQQEKQDEDEDEIPKCKAYGSYLELVQDSNVDIVYVATPHSHHYQNCMLALEHDKAILCEKALTVNAQQARILYDTALSKKLFFMEAVWTRYFPLSVQVRDWIRTGRIGTVQRVTADLSIGVVPEDAFADPANRMINTDLAGGCLLDLGIYALTWVFQTVYHTLPLADRLPPKVVGTVMTPYPKTGVDESTTILLSFPNSPPSPSSSALGRNPVHAVASTCFRAHFDSARNTEHSAPAVRVYGSKGEIQIYGPLYRPQRIKLIIQGKPAQVEDRKFDFPGGGHGMFWEADEAARCFLGGKLESETMTWAESMVIMETMDEVRRQGGLTYPEEIESTVYPLDLKARGK